MQVFYMYKLAFKQKWCQLSIKCHTVVIVTCNWYV